MYKFAGYWLLQKQVAEAVDRGENYMSNSCKLLTSRVGMCHRGSLVFLERNLLTIIYYNTLMFCVVIGNEHQEMITLENLVCSS